MGITNKPKNRMKSLDFNNTTMQEVITVWTIDAWKMTSQKYIRIDLVWLDDLSLEKLLACKKLNGLTRTKQKKQSKTENPKSRRQTTRKIKWEG